MHNELSKFVIFLCTLVLSLGKTHKAITISFNVILLPSVKLLHEILVNHMDHKGRVIGRTSLLVRARNLQIFNSYEEFLRYKSQNLRCTKDRSPPTSVYKMACCVLLGSLSNHDDDGNKNPTNLHI